MGGGGKSGARAMEKEAERARKQEQERQARIRQGMESIDTTFSQFDDEFFAGQQEAYRDFAMPQLDDQFDKAQENLTYDLARKGILDSSMRADRVGDLTKQKNLAEQDITSKALAAETESRAKIEQARSSLANSLYATGDAQAASQGALSQAAFLSQPEDFSSLGSLFTDAASMFGQQVAAERAHQMYGDFGAPKPAFNTGLYRANDSVRVK